MNQLRCQHESGGIINYGIIEVQEQLDASTFLLPDDCVLELGGRWGGVSIIINSQLKDKTKHLVVEPDSRVWEVLEKNRDTHGCQFHIVKGAISNQKLNLDIDDKKYHGLASFTKPSTDGRGDVPIYKLQDFEDKVTNFNVLIADCEGFLETFFDENKEIFKNLRLILFEKDRPEACDYDRLKEEFKQLGFFEYRDNGEHCVFIRQII
jgi:FkbM family methyltransferase